VTAIKDDGGIELTRPIIEKLSLQDLYPPSLRSSPGLERDSALGRWGAVLARSLDSRFRPYQQPLSGGQIGRGEVRASIANLSGPPDSCRSLVLGLAGLRHVSAVASHL
jgi:hypothetical protein